MTIKIFTDRIDIGDFTLFEGNGGVQFDGVARAEKFQAQGHFQGDLYSYLVGGYSAGVAHTNFIDSFNIVSESNLIRNAATLFQGRDEGAGQSSATHGYSSGGSISPPGNTNTIQKFSFLTDSNGTDVGDLLVATDIAQGQSSTTHGYTSGGVTPPPASVNTIQKFPFAADAGASDVGDLGITNVRRTGQTSAVSGYSSGGVPTITQIDKFPFATDSNSIDIGDLTQGRYRGMGCSSEVSGYQVGGGYAPKNTIDKFPFATNSNATDVGDMGSTRWAGTGTSGRTNGFVVGIGPVVKHIQKHSFVTDQNGIAFGSMGFYRGSGGSEGQQH